MTEPEENVEWEARRMKDVSEGEWKDRALDALTRARHAMHFYLGETPDANGHFDALREIIEKERGR